MQVFEFNGIRFAKYQQYVFDDITGLDEGEVATQTGQYLEQDGVDILSAYYEPRIVTLSGHILADNDMELYTLRRQLTKACNGKTKSLLKYSDGYRTYFSEAIAELPQFGKRLGNSGKTALPFSVNFYLYNFYWKDDSKNIEHIFKATNHLGNSFMFPLVFTTLTTISNVINGGDVECPLTIKITGRGAAVGDDGFNVINNTTGRFIKVEHNITDGEVVTIDTQELTITSNISGNILHKITSDSTLDLKLKLGINEIECLNYASNEIFVTAEYYDMFVGV